MYGIHRRVGYTRFWNEELDAVACVGLAWFDGAPKATPARMFAYADDGAREFLSRNEIKARVATARKPTPNRRPTCVSCWKKRRVSHTIPFSGSPIIWTQRRGARRNAP